MFIVTSMYLRVTPISSQGNNVPYPNEKLEVRLYAQSNERIKIRRS